MDDVIRWSVVPVTTYAVVRSRGGQSHRRGAHDDPNVAYEVALAFCKDEHRRYGWGPDDPRIQYPARIAETVAEGDTGLDKQIATATSKYYGEAYQLGAANIHHELVGLSAAQPGGK